MHQSHSKTSPLEISKFQESKAILKQLVDQQDQLVKALLTSFPNFSDLERLTDFPQSEGTVKALGIQWKFRKHGVGFTFLEADGKTIINMHKWLSSPKFFDACRISLYLSSIRWKGEKDSTPSERNQIYSEKGAKDWLRKMANEGIIETVPNDKTHYQLV